MLQCIILILLSREPVTIRLIVTSYTGQLCQDTKGEVVAEEAAEVEEVAEEAAKEHQLKFAFSGNYLYIFPFFLLFLLSLAKSGTQPLL